MTKKLAGMKNGTINVHRDLNDEEYASYRTNLKILIDFSSEQQIFKMVQINFEELENILDEYLLEFQNKPDTNWVQLEQMNMNLNRLMLNLLSSFRTLLDHMHYNLCKCYGKKSNIIKEFKELCSEQYDGYFSYRFLYKLRNYAQHCGMPIGELSISSKVISKKTKKIEYKLSVYFDRDKLLEGYDAWGPIKNEITNLPSKFDVVPFIDELMQCVSRINSFFINKKITDLIISVEYLEKLVKSCTKLNETPIILDGFKENTINSDMEIKLERLPIHIIDMVKSVKKVIPKI